MAELTDDQLRDLLQRYTVINDGYLERLDRKDTKILQQDKRIEELEEENRKLRDAMFPVVPEKAEVTE